MPLFTYRCPAAHETELLRPRDVEVVSCACGEPASRQSVYPISFSGFLRPPVDQREIKMGAFNEASQELAYAHERAEYKTGETLPTPPLWRTAKAAANKLIKQGAKDSLDVPRLVKG